MINKKTLIQDEIVGKVFPQHCGDELLVLNKTDKRDNLNRVLFEVQFKNHPYKDYRVKQDIKRGWCLNPQIEIDEFINKKWLQNCGDSLIIDEKTNIKKGSEYLWKCHFENYFCEILETKGHIKKGLVNNPQIELKEFIGKEFPQYCGDILIPIEKTNKKNKSGNFYYKCIFTKYKCEILALKGDIKKGICLNPALPWKSKENLIKYIKENFREKPTLLELQLKIKEEFNIEPDLKIIINKYNLRDFINFYLSSGEFSLREYIKSIYNGEIITYNGKKEENFREIDIYLPKLKIGFEFNGSYWHNKKEQEQPGYHEEKKEIFIKKGIKIYYIWDYFWFEDEKCLIVRQEAKDYIRNIIFNKF